MAIKKSGEKWQVDIQPGGRGGRRIRKSFDTKAEALRFERFAQHKAQSGEPWQAEKKDSRRLSDLVEAWHQLHGVGLKDGESRRRKLNAITERMGNPQASMFTAAEFVSYRAKRLDEVGENTANHELAYMRALFNELRRLGHWKGENPLALVRKLKTDEQELSFLTLEQIDTLLATLDASRNPDAGKVARVCLATGARWSEAESLRAEHITPQRVTFGETKNGRVRSVPITKELYETIRRPGGRLFTSCYSTFRGGVKRAGFELPAGQLSHVLRHTFASHFMQAGGNILTLQRILGHQSLQMTMRYAHLAPDHLEEAKRLNPLALRAAHKS
ncbi:MAG: tyrosine-type recombinase/integrase [Bacillota bacterium]